MMLHENNALPRLLAVSGEFFKSMLLLLALMAVSGNVRAEKVEIFKDNFNSYDNIAAIKKVWTLSGSSNYVDFAGNDSNKALQLASSSKDGSATTPSFSTLVGNTAILTFRVRSAASSGSEVRTLTIAGNSCKVNGSNTTTVSAVVGSENAALQTIAITSASTKSSISFSAATGKGCVIDDVEIYYTYAPSTITLSEVCSYNGKYYATFSSSSPFVVPDELTVSEIKVVSEKLQVSDYTTGAVVPANTGVLVSSSTAGGHILTLQSSGGTSLLGDDNMLKPTGDAGITVEGMYATSTKFYRLTMHNGTQIGFWWGAEDGVAFDLGANKAYLAVPDAAAARLQGLWLDDDTEGIAGMNREAADDSHPVYDLQGRQIVNGKSANGKWQRGLYIQNGRKVVKR